MSFFAGFFFGNCECNDDECVVHEDKGETNVKRCGGNGKKEAE